MYDPATRPVNPLPALLKLAFEWSDAMTGQDAERRSQLDKALREMMRAANDLPIPEELLAFVEALDEAADEDRTDPAL